MYHRIKPPTCVPQLEQLINLARLTIAFAIENDPASVMCYQTPQARPQANLANRLGSGFLDSYGGSTFLGAVEQAFLAYFEQHATRRAGEWLWAKYSIIGEPVVRLLTLSSQAKEGLLDTFAADIRVYLD